VSAMRDPRLRYVRLHRHLGLPGALNAGFALAAGEYLTWTSDDNRYEPEAVEVMLGFLRDNPRYGMVYCDFWEVDPGGKRVRRQVEDPSFLWTANVVGACFLYARRVYLEVGDYDPELALAEDYDYWLRVHGRYEMAALHLPLYRFLAHTGSLTALRRDEVARAARRARWKNRRTWPMERRVLGNLGDLGWQDWIARRARRPLTHVRDAVRLRSRVRAALLAARGRSAEARALWRGPA